jgi:hypothetical protein
VGLPFRVHLHAVLRPAQEGIGAAQCLAVRRRQHADLSQGGERALRRPVAHLRDASAVQELQGLGDQLDVANAAGADLEAERGGAAPLRLLDLFLHGFDCSDAAVVHRRAVDDRVDGANCLPPEGEVAGDRPRLHERGLFPGRRPGVVVIGEHRVRDDERTRLTLGAQIEVDAIEEALARRLVHQPGELVRDPRVVFDR